MSLKSYIHGVMEPGDEDSKYFDPFIISLIVLNIFVVIIESVRGINDQYGTYLYYFDSFSVAVFTVEYGLRMWTCTEDPRFAGMVRGRLKYAFTIPAIVDLLAFLPHYLPMIFPELRFLRVLRIFRILRVLKLARYSKSIHIFRHVWEDTKGEVGFLLFMIMVLLILSSSAMFEAESVAQPDKFTSIPATMWWAIVTLTTVGYGDLYPITDVGKVVGSISVLLGIALVAILTGIIGSGFTEVVAERDQEKRCIHCGKLVYEEKEA